MHYWIDGYNLLFRILRARHNEQFKEQRQQFILELTKKIHLAGISASLVFDSHYQSGSGNISFVMDVDVHFTDEGQTADDYILAQIKNAAKPKQHIVVTSDGRLAWQVRLRQGSTQSVEEFLSFINRVSAKKIRLNPQVIQPKLQKKTLSLEERYLNVFEEKLKTEPTPPVNKLPNGQDKRPRRPKEITKSDFDRWLEAFNEDRNGA